MSIPALGGLPEGNQALGHSDSTWILGVCLGTGALGGYSEGTRRALKRHSKDTGALKALRHLST